MAVPLIPIVVMVGRSVGVALKRWPTIVGLVGLIFATGFMFNAMLRQMGETAISLWPLLMIACLTLILKEVVRAWLKIRQSEIKKGGVEK